MKLKLLTSALISVLVLTPFSALAESGLLQHENRLSCEKLQQYYPLVKSQLAFTSKAAAESQSRIERLKQQLDGRKKGMLAELEHTYQQISSLVANMSRISSDAAAKQKIIAELSKKESLNAEEKIVLARAKWTVDKAQDALATQSAAIKTYKTRAEKIKLSLSRQSDDVLEALQSVQRQARHFSAQAIASEKELSKTIAELKIVCK